MRPTSPGLQLLCYRAFVSFSPTRPRATSSSHPPAAISCFSHSAPRRENGHPDPRIRDLGREIADDFARVREAYDTPKYPLVLAHGLLGFSELRLVGNWLPPIQYWFGIRDALVAKEIKVITTSVPASATIQERAAKLRDEIAAAVSTRQRPSHGISSSASSSSPITRHDRERGVNIIAHSMGGLDARYLIAHLQSSSFPVRIRSLVTIATPHRGSSVADALMESSIGPAHLPHLYHFLERTVGLDTGAFAQLTTTYMRDEFNPSTPDDPSVRYFSYGATTKGNPPSLLSPFRRSHRLLEELEGPNDGLVSVESSKWGVYKGTLVGLNHLDLINWSNRLRWAVRGWIGQQKQTFNAIAFYLDIADMLAKEGL